ncbi:MAG TPA: hypothetical protein VMN99_08380 [Anaerolineales bacterium]|nr:hypothetical protein [Anaerolineales bacterium]
MKSPKIGLSTTTVFASLMAAKVFWILSKHRFILFIESLTHNGLHREADILLVGHGGLFQLMLPLLLTNFVDSVARLHGIGHTEYVLAEQRHNGLVCLQWGTFRFDR